jgi:hypothetical protein
LNRRKNLWGLIQFRDFSTKCKKSFACIVFVSIVFGAPAKLFPLIRRPAYFFATFVDRRLTPGLGAVRGQLIPLITECELLAEADGCRSGGKGENRPVAFGDLKLPVT